MTREEYMTKNIELNNKIRKANIECEEAMMEHYNTYMDTVAEAAKKKREEDRSAKIFRAIRIESIQSALQRLKTEYMMQLEEKN